MEIFCWPRYTAYVFHVFFFHIEINRDVTIHTPYTFASEKKRLMRL